MRIGEHSIAHNFSLSIKKYLNSEIKELTNRIKDDLKRDTESWLNLVRKALNKKLPATDKPHGRTKDRARLFPYRRTGELRNSPRVTVKSFRLKDRVRIFMSGGIASKRGDYPTDGAWMDWKEDVIFGSGRGGIPSLRDVFNELIQKRRSMI